MRSAFAAMAVLAGTLTGAGAQQVTCTNSGNIYQVGETACVKACHQDARLARCESGTGGATWIYLAEACPSAGLLESQRLARLIAAPDITAMTPIPARELPAASMRQATLFLAGAEAVGPAD